MWIFTKTGFVSIVAHRTTSGTMIVRARRRADLEGFVAAFGGPKVRPVEILETPDADYRFRAFMPKKNVAMRVMQLALEVDYPNFKAAAGTDPVQAGVLHRVWANTQGLDERKGSWYPPLGEDAADLEAPCSVCGAADHAAVDCELDEGRVDEALGDAVTRLRDHPVTAKLTGPDDRAR